MQWLNPSNIPKNVSNKWAFIAQFNMYLAHLIAVKMFYNPALVSAVVLAGHAHIKRLI